MLKCLLRTAYCVSTSVLNIVVGFFYNKYVQSVHRTQQSDSPPASSTLSLHYSRTYARCKIQHFFACLSNAYAATRIAVASLYFFPFRNGLPFVLLQGQKWSVTVNTLADLETLFLHQGTQPTTVNTEADNVAAHAFVHGLISKGQQKVRRLLQFYGQRQRCVVKCVKCHVLEPPLLLHCRLVRVDFEGGRVHARMQYVTLQHSHRSVMRLQNVEVKYAASNHGKQPTVTINHVRLHPNREDLLGLWRYYSSLPPSSAPFWSPVNIQISTIKLVAHYRNVFLATVQGVCLTNQGQHLLCQRLLCRSFLKTIVDARLLRVNTVTNEVYVHSLVGHLYETFMHRWYTSFHDLVKKSRDGGCRTESTATAAANGKMKVQRRTANEDDGHYCRDDSDSLETNCSSTSHKSLRPRRNTREDSTVNLRQFLIYNYLSTDSIKSSAQVAAPKEERANDPSVAPRTTRWLDSTESVMEKSYMVFKRTHSNDFSNDVVGSYMFKEAPLWKVQCESAKIVFYKGDGGSVKLLGLQVTQLANKTSVCLADLHCVHRRSKLVLRKLDRTSCDILHIIFSDQKLYLTVANLEVNLIFQFFESLCGSISANAAEWSKLMYYKFNQGATLSSFWIQYIFINQFYTKISYFPVKCNYYSLFTGNLQSMYTAVNYKNLQLRMQEIDLFCPADWGDLWRHVLSTWVRHILKHQLKRVLKGIRFMPTQKMQHYFNIAVPPPTGLPQFPIPSRPLAPVT